MSEPSKEKLFCNSCGHETRHTELKLHRTEGADDEAPVYWYDLYSILECGGCGDVHFRHRHMFSEDQHPDPSAEPVYQDNYFPPRQFRIKPRWFSELPDELTAVLTEVYIGLQNGLGYLSAVGARTALDLILVEKISDQGTFVAKLKSLEDGKFVNSDERELLEAVLEAGNAAAHRGFAPESSDLVVVMDILETIIEKLYFKERQEKELKERASRLRKRIPPRK